jgi:hypothetical protein
VRLDDPVTAKFIHVWSATAQAANSASSLHKTLQMLNVELTRPQELSTLETAESKLLGILDAAVVGGESSGSSLAWLYERYDTFISVAMVAEAHLQIVLRELQLEPTDPEFAAPGLAFDELQLLVKDVTAEQLALQAHLELLVRLAPNVGRLGEERYEKLFGPLFDLRDEYFLTGKPGLLAKYLAKVKPTRVAIKKTDFNYLLDRDPMIELKLDSLHDRLEVMSMLEVLS